MPLKFGSYLICIPKTLKIDNPITKAFSQTELKMLYIVWKKSINTPLSSSCGRVFDCVASTLDILQISSFEGQGGLLLEKYFNKEIKEYYSFQIKDNQIDFIEIFEQILKESNRVVAVTKFFNSLVEIIYRVSCKYNLPVVISGGVFQNRVLLRVLKKRIDNLILPNEFLSNDQSIALGQIYGVGQVG